MSATRTATYFHIHLVSDSTGETLNAMGRAVCSRFDDVLPIEHLYPLVRSQRQLDRVLEEIQNAPGIVLHTIVDLDLRQALEEGCRSMDMTCIPALDPLMAALSRYLGAQISMRVGAQHALDNDYFNRMEALNYAIAHDDGQGHKNLEQADVVLVGISRTSKTPTCIYLAHRGIKAANVPLVPGGALPDRLTTLKNPMIVGLTASPDRLQQIRRNRLLSLKEERESSYVDIDAIREESVQARRMYEKHGWPIIDVTRRSVEETAAAILNLLTAGRGQVEISVVTAIVLASQSQARASLLRGAGVAFTTASSGVDEDAAKQALLDQGAFPAEVATALAEAKALAVARTTDAIVIGADQTLDFHGHLIDKAADLAEARERLLSLRGHTHRLHSAVVAARGEAVIWRDLVSATLHVRKFSDAWLDDYLAANGQAVLSSVGCYQLEGAGVQLFDRIEGDYFAILGLPLTGLLQFLRHEGVLAS